MVCASKPGPTIQVDQQERPMVCDEGPPFAVQGLQLIQAEAQLIGQLACQLRRRTAAARPCRAPACIHTVAQGGEDTLTPSFHWLVVWLDALSVSTHADVRQARVAQVFRRRCLRQPLKQRWQQV
jgi:hypothetical protein